MVSLLHLEEHAKGERFASRIEKTYDKAISQARAVFDKAKLSDLLGS